LTIWQHRTSFGSDIYPHFTVFDFSNAGQAGIAQTVKFKTNRDDGKAPKNNMARVRHSHGEHNISYPVAFLAAYMLMETDVAVKTLATAGGFDFENFTLLGKQIKVAVYRTQTDAWQALAHDMIYLIRRWMNVCFAQLLKYNRPLPRYALLM